MMIDEGNYSVTVDENGKIFRRVATRGLGGGAQLHTIVGELDGVRVYVRSRDGKISVVLTDQDLYE